MKDKALQLIKNPMVGGGSIVFIGTLLANIINYIFNLTMGRLLTVSDYGLMVSLNSLLILVSIFSVSFVNIITKFSAKYHSTNNRAGAHTLIQYGARFIVTFSSILLVILIVLTPLIGQFLHIKNDLYIFIIEVSVFTSLILALPAGFIQGALRFYFLSGITIIQPVIRLVVALIFIYLGFSILGPIVGIMLASAIPALFLTVYLFRKYSTSHQDSSFNVAEFKKEFFHYTYSYFLSGIGITLLSNTDILLVRHFFDPTISGQYAALSLMGKAILYFTTPIATVFFPIIAYKKERKERLLETVLLASGAVVGLSAILSAAYFAVPDLVLKVFFPKPEYHLLTHYLGFFSLYILVFSFASLLNSYFLSVGRTKVYIITLVGAALQVFAIIFFHQSLFEVIAGLFIASLVMLLLLIIYYFKHGEDN